MIKRYILERVVAGLALMALALPGAAQDTKVSDTLPHTVPGRLFTLPANRSTGAVAAVSGETLYKTTAPNLSNTLFGRLAGLTALQNFGEPGNDDAALGIRGAGSYGYGAYGAFKIFVDGFETNYNYFRYLAPSEIEDIAILKDAAALATFGMRGANGIIWVTTKRGKAGKPTVQFRTRTSMQKPINVYKPLDSWHFATLYNQAVSNDNGNVWQPYYSEEELQSYKNGAGTNVDWYDHVLKDKGAYSDADLVFQGGEKNARYSVIMNYGNQNGLYNVPKTDTSSNELFRRYALRTNLDFDMFRIFEARVSIGARIEEQKMPNYGWQESTYINRSSSNTSSPIWNYLASYPSNVYPVRDKASGNWSGTNLYPNNPVATVSDMGWRYYKTRVLQGNFELKEKLDGILEGLYAKEAYSFNSVALVNYNKTSNFERYQDGVKTTNDQATPITASNLYPMQQEDWKQASVTLGFDRSFGIHHLTSAINYHMSDYKGDGFFVINNHYQNISGRFNYTYKDKYVGELGFSYFGSDAFAPGNRWGFYPAISAAWIVSNEDFLKDNAVVSRLKLRASAGKTGFTETDEGSMLSGQNGRYLYQQYYAYSTTLYTGDGQVNSNSGLNPLYIANPDIFAEQSMKYNVGADLNLFHKLDLALDVYLDKRSGIVTLDNTIPGSFGNNSISTNLGKQTNKGFEVTAAFNDKIGKLGYSITGIAGYNKNSIDYMGEVPNKHDYSAQTGKAYGSYIGLVADGFYDITDFNPDGTLKAGLAAPAFGNVQAGDIRYKDLDGDGIVNNDDRTTIGKPAYPQFTYALGLNLDYKGFDLGIFLQGISGSSVNILNNQTMAFVNNGNAFPIALGAWAYYPDQHIDTRATATYPRLTTLGNDNNYISSSFWVKKRDFLRVRNLELGYSFAEKWLERMRMTKLRLYVSATNPFTWSKLLSDYHIDPETMYGYPALKSYTVGIDVSF